MDNKCFVDVKEFSKGRYTRSNYLYDEQSTEMLRRAPVMPDLNRKSSEVRKSSSKKLSRDHRDDYRNGLSPRNGNRSATSSSLRCGALWLNASTAGRGYQNS